MTLFGITGGIGMGKSTAGNLLLQEGYSVIDTDSIARQVVQPGQPALKEIQSCFGDHVVTGYGELNREQLAKIVFSDPASRQNLESILHPRIREVWQKEVEGWRSQGKSFGFVIIPLLFETGAAASFDAVVCIACSQETQFERLKARGWDSNQIIGRMEAQWPVERKMAAAEYVVWTESSPEVLRAQLQRILASTPSKT